LFAWGGDYPAIIGSMVREVLGRPTSENFGPFDLMRTMNETFKHELPVSSRRKGVAQVAKSKALPASRDEREEETTRRKEAQAESNKLILPRPKHEPSELFLRRIDAHRTNPDAIIAPFSLETEEPMQCVKRFVATKNMAHPGLMVLPKVKVETATEFEQRLAVCQKCPSLVLPRGVHESADDFKRRMAKQAEATAAIMPRSAKEEPTDFQNRCVLAVRCEETIHPYDAARETLSAFECRLRAQKEYSSEALAPGDEKVLKLCPPVLSNVANAPGLSSKKVEPVQEQQGGEATDAKQKEEDDEEGQRQQQDDQEPRAKLEVEVEAPSAPLSSGAKPVESAKVESGSAVSSTCAASPSKFGQAGHTGVVLGPTFLRPSEPEETKRPSQMEELQVSFANMGFMPLKRLLIERGVPKEEVNKASNKFLLKEIGDKYAEMYKLSFI